MKRFYDMVCDNKECQNSSCSQEIFKHTDTEVICDLCGQPMRVSFEKSPSVYLKNGVGGNWQNDGWINTGNRKGVRRT